MIDEEGKARLALLQAVYWLEISSSPVSFELLLEFFGAQGVFLDYEQCEKIDQASFKALVLYFYEKKEKIYRMVETHFKNNRREFCDLEPLFKSFFLSLVTEFFFFSHKRQQVDFFDSYFSLLRCFYGSHEEKIFFAFTKVLNSLPEDEVY